MSWLKLFNINKPIHYPRLLSKDWFNEQKILNTNTPLFKDVDKVYKDYIIKYNSYTREQKLKELGI